MNKQSFQILLTNKTHCKIQHNGWPCGTCFFAVNKKLTNKDWQTVLLYRGDYKRQDLTNIPKPKNIADQLKHIEKIFKNN